MRPLQITIRRSTGGDPERRVFAVSPIIIGTDSDATLCLSDASAEIRAVLSFDEHSAELQHAGTKDYIVVDAALLAPGESCPITDASIVRWGSLELRFAPGAAIVAPHVPLDETAADPEAPVASGRPDDVGGSGVPVFRPRYSPFELGQSEAPKPRLKPRYVALPAGTKFGRYETIELLGIGGMGAVYKGWDPGVHRTVAIKVLGADGVARPEVVERFGREATNAARIKHLNVVDIYDIGVANGVPYIVMEFLRGEEADTLIKRRRLEITAWSTLARGWVRFMRRESFIETSRPGIYSSPKRRWAS
jgi:hypothetical protein